MIEGSLSRRYTRAIFQLAREAGQEEKVGQEIEQFYTAYSSSELQGVLTNPTYGLDSRKNVLVPIVEVQQLSPLTGHFLSLLLDRDHLTYLPSIVAFYRRRTNEGKGRDGGKV